MRVSTTSMPGPGPGAAGTLGRRRRGGDGVRHFPSQPGRLAPATGATGGDRRIPLRLPRAPVAVSADQKLPLALRQAAQHHSRRTYVELLSFIGEHGAYPRTERLLKGPPNAEVRPEFLAPPPHFAITDGEFPCPTPCRPLPYAYDALEPHIDALTMEIHPASTTRPT